MSELFKALVPFLAILNPFALCLYLAGVMEDLDTRQFAAVLARACAISLAVFSLFSLTGDALLLDMLGVRPDAMRAFGGVVFFVVAYTYVTRGYRAAEILRGSLDELPSAIALPFMIGAGTITQAILIGKQHPVAEGVLVLAVGVLVSFVVVLAFKLLRDRMRQSRERVFERYVNTLARINGLLIGAISTEMVVTGLQRLWQST